MDRHVPAFECRTPGTDVDGVRRDLNGPDCALTVYAARAFRFGQPRADAAEDGTRIVFDLVEAGTDISSRFSLSLGDALRLSRIVERLVDHVSYL